MKLICGLALMAFTLWGQNAADKMQRKLIQLKYVDAERVSRLLQSPESNRMRADSQFHAITLFGTSEEIASVEEFVKKLDVPPLDFELSVFLISTSPQAGDVLPEALASTAKQMHSVFAYKGYQLVDSFILRGRDGQTNASAEGTIRNSTYAFRYGRASVLDGSPKIVNLQNVSLQIRTPTGARDGKGNAEVKMSGLNSDIDVRDGQKVVVGKSDINSGESPLILVVTAKIVE